MQNVSDLIWNDQSTMERVCKIIEGIWNGIVFFGNEGEGDIVCHIGEYWFYFYNGDLYASQITPENIKGCIGIFELAQMILNAMINLDDDEYTYYCDILQFA